ALRRLFYALLSYSLLIAGYVALLAVTLNLSTVVVQGGDAAKTCISSGNSGCAPNVTSDEKSAVFLARTSVRGRDYTARVGDAVSEPFQQWPWVASKVDTASFVPPPTVLVRVPYPHSALVGGVIEIRDETGKVVASAETS